MPHTIRFDEYVVDLPAGQLYKHGARIRLRDKSFQVLAALLEHPGQVVTREELRRRLWQDEVFVDFDNNLNTLVATLREALGDSADHPRYIETLPKHGHRFLGRVSEEPRAHEEILLRRTKLAVLPFVNLSGDPTQEYFSDAMTDEIITTLAALAPEQLAVIARTTAMHYKGSRRAVSDVGRQLGIDYVVEGGVRRAEGRLVINLQLVRVSDQMHVWAQQYDAEQKDIFKVHRCIADAIAVRIGITPDKAVAGHARVAKTTKTPTENLAAYNEFIQGRHYLARLSPEGLTKARQHFEEALARDPGFALACDSLAEAYWYFGYFGFMRPIDAFSTGVLYAVRALEIDNTLAETHALLAQYHKQLEYNWPEVEREMRRALTLNPNSALVRTRYAFNALMPHGRLEEAVAELDHALELDPLSAYIRTGLAITLHLWRRHDRALAEAQRVLELEPNAYWGHIAIGATYRDTGRFEEAIAPHRRAAELSGEAPAMLGWLGLCLAKAGKTEEARGLLKRLQESATRAYVPPTSVAWIYLGLGETDSAFAWLDRAVDERDQFMMPIKSYAFFDPIRDDPRFHALLRKMNLEP